MIYRSDCRIDVQEKLNLEQSGVDVENRLKRELAIRIINDMPMDDLERLFSFTERDEYMPMTVKIFSASLRV